MSFVRDSRLAEGAYGVLGLERCATESEVRAAWRRAARETHPDVGGDAVAFRVAREAYETLIDPERRAAHDRLLDARSSTRSSGGAPEAQAASTPPARRTVGVRDLVLIVANVVVVLRAIDVLRGGQVLPPRGGDFLFPLPAGGVRLWVASMNLLELPWVFLLLSSVATAVLVMEVVHEWSEGAPLLDAPQWVFVRVVQTALPAPLALGVTLAAVTLAVQIVLMLLIVAMFLVGIQLLFLVLSD